MITAPTSERELILCCDWLIQHTRPSTTQISEMAKALSVSGDTLTIGNLTNPIFKWEVTDEVVFGLHRLGIRKVVSMSSNPSQDGIIHFTSLYVNVNVKACHGWQQMVGIGANQFSIILTGNDLLSFLNFYPRIQTGTTRYLTFMTFTSVPIVLPVHQLEGACITLTFHISGPMTFERPPHMRHIDRIKCVSMVVVASYDGVCARLGTPKCSAARLLSISDSVRLEYVGGLLTGRQSIYLTPRIDPIQLVEQLLESGDNNNIQLARMI